MATILVLGSCGFIGRHVVALLQERGHTVMGVDSLDERVHPTPPKMGCSTYLGTYVGTPQHMLDECDAVIHLAAQVSVADSATDPLRYITQNTADTAAFLMRLPPKRLIVASSMSVYGEGGALVKETAPVCPTSVYGLTKYDQERLCLMWGQQHRVPVTALRFFNVYGPGQALTNPYTGVLANFAQRLLRGEAPLVYEDGQQTRDFVHVRDVAEAVVTALTESEGGVYNVCRGDPVTVWEAGQRLAQATGSSIEPLVTGQTRPGDIRHCTGDPQKAWEDFGFAAKTAFMDGIQEYGAWLIAGAS